MILSLIGMSNCGKTYWSKKLETAGFKRFSCDDYIEEKLNHELKKLGYAGIQDVSKWLGQPYDKRHAKNSQIYLKFERESLRKFIQFAKEDSVNQQIVIDTTGSVIYTGKKILHELRKYSQIIYLDTPQSVKEDMYQSYLGNPKPVLWGDVYRKRNGESDLAALKRCYLHLLEYRIKKYKEITHLTLDYFLLRALNFSVKDFLSHVSMFRNTVT